MDFGANPDAVKVVLEAWQQIAKGQDNWVLKTTESGLEDVVAAAKKIVADYATELLKTAGVKVQTRWSGDKTWYTADDAATFVANRLTDWQDSLSDAHWATNDYIAQITAGGIVYTFTLSK